MISTVDIPVYGSLTYYRFIMLILPAFRDIIYPGDIDKKKAEFGLTDEPALRALLLRLMMDILLMPYRFV